MSFKTAFIKSRLFVAGIALSAGLARSAQAQTANIRLAGGGSSALLGDLRPASYGPGALPQVIGQIGGIPTYSTSAEKVLIVAGSAADPIEITRNTPGGGTVVESFSTAAPNGGPDSLEIRFTDAGGGSANVIILLRSDSGQGVRYLSNSGRITRIPTTAASYASVSPTATNLINNPALAADFSNGSVTNVLTLVQNAINAGGIPIDTGLSDVAADTVITYSGVGTGGTTGINVVGLSGVNNFDNITPVQTLLMLYNANVYTGGAGNAFPVNFTRSQVRNLINGVPASAPASAVPAGGRAADSLLWNDIDGRLRSDLYVSTAFREATSGTRMTEVTNIQRYDRSTAGILGENASSLLVNPGPDVTNFYHALGLATVTSGGVAKNDPGGSSPAINGTGDIVNFVNTGYQTANAAPNPDVTNNLVNGAVFGYAFITGGAGNNKPNVRVGLFNGVAPYRQNPAVTAGSGLNITSDLALPAANTSNQNANSAGTKQTDYATVANTAGGVSGASLPFYTEVINGRYELWSYTHAYTRQATTGSVAAAVFSPLNNLSGTYSPIVHRAGLTQQGEMQAVRAGVASSFLPGSVVTDGYFVNPDAAGAVGLSNILD